MPAKAYSLKSLQLCALISIGLLHIYNLPIILFTCVSIKLASSSVTSPPRAMKIQVVSSLLGIGILAGLVAPERGLNFGSSLVKLRIG